jgi:hypothetical protein
MHQYPLLSMLATLRWAIVNLNTLVFVIYLEIPSV